MCISERIAGPLKAAEVTSLQVVRLSLEFHVDGSLCAGCGACEKTCASVFGVAYGIARTKAKTIPRGLEAQCFDALEDCPSGAISVREVAELNPGLLTV